jgi:beta-lactamase class A
MKAMREKIEALRGNLKGRVGYIIESRDGSTNLRANERGVFPSASIIKLTILWAVFRSVEDGRAFVSETAIMRDKDVVGGYGVLKDLHPGIELTVGDMCSLMICYSDNVATNMLIDRFGMDYINEEVRGCGLTDTVLNRKMMDSEAKARGLDNYTSPLDVVNLLKLYLDSDRISKALREEMTGILYRQFCNNFLAHFMPEGFRFAHKTGDLPGTLHDVGILYPPSGQAHFIAVMCDGLEGNEDGLRFLNEAGSVIFSHLTLI